MIRERSALDTVGRERSMSCRFLPTRKTALRGVVVVSMLAAWWSPAAAQTQAAPAQMNMADHRGSVRGVVRNDSGAPVANTTVTAINAENGAKFESTTDAQGNYLFGALPMGKYEITIASSAGMTAFRRTGVAVEMD